MIGPALRMLAVVLCTTVPGFAHHDLTKLPVDPAAVLGEGFEARADSARVLMTCPGCAGAPIAEIRLGRQDDGTEARVRAGTTTPATLEGLCRQRDPACRIQGLDVSPAVGWMSSYRLGEQSAHTVIVLRDGDLLTIRSISTDAAVARRNAEMLVSKLVPVIVGN
jgi:hypothetical protein